MIFNNINLLATRRCKGAPGEKWDSGARLGHKRDAVDPTQARVGHRDTVYDIGCRVVDLAGTAKIGKGSFKSAGVEHLGHIDI